MTKLFDKLKALAAATPFDQAAYDKELAALEKTVAEMEQAAGKAETDKKEAITKIVEANKKTIEAKDADISALKAERDAAIAAKDAEIAQLNTAHQAALQQANEAKDQAVAAKETELNAAHQAALQQANEAKDQAVAAKETELNAAHQAALQQANAAKDQAVAATATEKARADKAEAELATAKKDINNYHSVFVALEKHMGITRGENTFVAIQKALIGAYDAVKDKVTSAETALNAEKGVVAKLLGAINGVKKYLDPKAANVEAKDAGTVESTLKAMVDTNKVNAAKAAAPNAPVAQRYATAAWSKGRMFAAVSFTLAAGCVIGAVAYNKSSAVQSLYKVCADSKVGCKLSDIGSFVGKLFTRSASAGVAR